MSLGQVRANHLSGVGRRVLHRRKPIRNQSPRIVPGRIGRVSLVFRVINALAHGRGSRNPIAPRPSRTRILPVPVVNGRVNFLARTRCHVRPKSIHNAGNRPLPLLNFNQPSSACADRIGSRGLALQQKRRPVCHLCNRSVDPEVPHRCGNQVIAGLQQRCQVKPLVAPVRQIPARGPIAHPMPIHKQHKPIVSAHSNHIACRNSRQGQRTPEVQHNRLPQRGRGMRDPRCVPVPMGWIGRKTKFNTCLAVRGSLGLSLKSEDRKGDCEIHQN